MKKLIILFILIFSISQVNAQSLTFGPLVGFNSSRLQTDFDNIKEEAKANFLFGVFLRMGSKIYFQPELLYTTKGGTLKAEDTNNGETNVKLRQMQIPALVGFRIINLELANIRVMGGPSAGFIIDKDVSAGDLVQDPVQAEDFKDVMWGFQLGTGVDVLFMTLDVRYEFGLNDIYKPSGDNVRNNLWHISLGFKLL